MIEFSVSEKVLKKAEEKAYDMGTFRGSILNGKGNVSGFIGEIILADILNAEIQNTFDYDLVMQDGSKIDVKTQTVKSVPRPYYECNVNEHSIKQRCDYYAFTRLHSNLSKGWYLGKISKGKFLDVAKYCKAGSASANFIFKLNCYTIPIKELEV